MRDVSPDAIRAPKFRTRFRGYDVKEVNAFLEEVSEEYDRLLLEHQQLRAEIRAKNAKLEEVLAENKKLTRTLAEAQDRAKFIEEQAQKQADFLISKAELTAEKMLNNAHKRLAQLHEDLAELKRQRTHFEVKLRSFIEAHLKLLDLEQESHREAEEMEGKIRFLNKG